MSFAILFPGQGSQSVGMGADVFEARPELLVGRSDAVLGWSLSEMCSAGPQEMLTRTEHAQPALFAVAYALWEELAVRLDAPPVAAAGHSLGEYTALAAAGTFDFEDGLRLVAARGKAMAAAADLEPSGMAALLGADEADAEALIEARRDMGGRLWVANVNAPGQVVVAGGEADIAWAAENSREHGIRRVIPLDVAGAFHSPFMESAANELSDAVAAVDFSTPSPPVWANATARPHGSDIGAGLVAQLTSPVLFAASLRAMADTGVTTFVHIGPGDVTAGLVKRSVEGTEPVVVSSVEDVDAAVDRLSAA